MNEIAKIKDIKRLAKKIKHYGSLCNFMGKTEKEVLVAQTIHAAVINYKKHKEPFSFDKVEGNSILCNNVGSFNCLVGDGYFITDKRQGKPVIFPTQLLIDKLDKFFKKENN